MVCFFQDHFESCWEQIIKKNKKHTHTKKSTTMFPIILWHNQWNSTLGRKGKRPKLVLGPVVMQFCFVVGIPYWFWLSRPLESILLCAEKIVNNQGEKHIYFFCISWSLQSPLQMRNFALEQDEKERNESAFVGSL